MRLIVICEYGLYKYNLIDDNEVTLDRAAPTYCDSTGVWDWSRLNLLQTSLPSGQEWPDTRAVCKWEVWKWEVRLGTKICPEVHCTLIDNIKTLLWSDIRLLQPLLHGPGPEQCHYHVIALGLTGCRWTLWFIGMLALHFIRPLKVNLHMLFLLFCRCVCFLCLDVYSHLFNHKLRAWKPDKWASSSLFPLTDGSGHHSHSCWFPSSPETGWANHNQSSETGEALVWQLRNGRWYHRW